ncbi:MAG: serine/threonine protein kinase [Cyanobacteria bacterium P01_H01_bin.119]
MTDKDRISQLIEIVNRHLRREIILESVKPHNPVEARFFPPPWVLLGTGNYAAVFAHPSYPNEAIKVYAPNRSGFEDEVEVYRRIGTHPAFSQCFYAEDNVLILKRMKGVTLYNCLHQGIRIPGQVILDIDRALDYARTKGLNPRDVHGKNVMMYEGRGLVVDISDFLKQGSGSSWNDFKRFYFWIYRPFLSPVKIRIPLKLLDFTRLTYRWLRSVLRRES